MKFECVYRTWWDHQFSFLFLHGENSQIVLTLMYFRACVGECQRTGCVGKRCFTNCNFSLNGSSLDGPWYAQKPLYLQWKQWDCVSDCRYHCMLDRELERAAHNQGPLKYHGKWPFKRLYGLQVCKFTSYTPQRMFSILFCFIFSKK